MNVIVDYRASKSTFDALLKLNYNVIKTPAVSSVYDAINGHSDIMFHKIMENKAVCEPSVYDYFKEKLPACSLKKGNTLIKNNYPYDIAYNVCQVSDKIICNIKYTDKEILNQYDEMGYRPIDVKQGYAKCSICVVSDNAIITADKGIAKIAEANDIDVLLTSNDDVKLPGMKNGFFGGATGLLSKDRLAVNGNIKYHRDHKRILDYCSNYGVNVISLNDEEIVDIGSIIVI